MKTDPTSSAANPHAACLGLGSNEAPATNLVTAVGRLRLLFPDHALSSAWQSPAVGVEGPDYVNAALLVSTPLSKPELVALLKRIESELGRVRGPVGSSRVPIDIDLLVYDGIVEEADLWNLAYRAVPVAELLPDLADPVTGEPVTTAALRLSSQTAIRARPDILPDAIHPRFAMSDAAEKGPVS